MIIYNGPVLIDRAQPSKKFNTLWGAEYLFMNEKTFMENKENKNYDKLIHMMVNIRKINASMGLV
jgi:hypothetical protein